MDDPTRFAPIGTGLTVFDHPDPVEGRVVWLNSPDAVLDLVCSDDFEDAIVLARGGTTTFLTPALAGGVKAVLTLQGSPESHLGILAREYGIPCLMAVTFAEGVTSERGETIPPDGATVRLDVSTYPRGQVLIAEADRNYGDAAAAGATAEDPAAAAAAEQMAALMVAYRGEIPDGVAGDREMRRRLRTGILDQTRENVLRDLEPAEMADFLAYCGWNLWDVIKSRQTEGESGLIPRQEYETIAFVQQWSTYARWFSEITDKIGPEGVIELGATPRREFGTKANHLDMWGIGVCPLVGRAIANQLGLSSDIDDARNKATIVQFFRRLQYGLWGDGPGFVAGRDYRIPVLAPEWLDRFRDAEHRLDDPDELAAFRAFNAATELTGFLLHYDNRGGLCDTGPYPLPDGGFLLVRDHVLYEPAFEWSGVLAGLPYCVTQAMFFRPDTPVEIRNNDIATTFANPRNYLQHLSGVAVFARDRWNTPMSDVRQIDATEMDTIMRRCNAAMLELYGTIAALPWDQRIRNGVTVYTRTMLMPWARAAGLWGDQPPPEFDLFSDLTEQAYPILAGGEAMPVLGGVFMLGNGLVPDTGLGTAPGDGAS
jgi:hypothetical protein